MTTPRHRTIPSKAHNSDGNAYGDELLGPNGGETRGFSGTCEDRKITKKGIFLGGKCIEHVFLMGKSIAHLQCHRIYIQHIWRYGSRFLTYFGMVTSEFLNFGRPVGAPALKNHCDKMF